jgi:hypothetical protein
MNFRWPKKNKPNGKVKYVDNQGSWFGGINTVAMMWLTLWLLLYKTTWVWDGTDDTYNNYQLINDFDAPETAIMNFSDQNIMHVLLFNIRRDEIFDNTIFEEMEADKKNQNTLNLDNYIEVFYASRFKDNINKKTRVLNYYKF